MKLNMGKKNNIHSKSLQNVNIFYILLLIINIITMAVHIVKLRMVDSQTNALIYGITCTLSEACRTLEVWWEGGDVEEHVQKK